MYCRTVSIQNFKFVHNLSLFSLFKANGDNNLSLTLNKNLGLMFISLSFALGRLGHMVLDTKTYFLRIRL